MSALAFCSSSCMDASVLNWTTDNATGLFWVLCGIFTVALQGAWKDGSPLLFGKPKKQRQVQQRGGSWECYGKRTVIVLGNESMRVYANIAVHFSVSVCKILLEEEVFHTHPLFPACSSLGLFFCSKRLVHTIVFSGLTRRWIAVLAQSSNFFSRILKCERHV